MIIIFIAVSLLIYFKLIIRLELPPGKAFYSWVFLVLSCLYTTFIDTYNNSFFWPHIAEHAAAYKLLNPNILQEDFIINGTLASPKIIFLKMLVFFPATLGLNLALLLEFMDAFAQIFSPAIFYLATAGIICNIGSKSEETKSFVFYFLFVFLLCNYYFQFFTKNLSFSYFQTFSVLKHISYSTSFSFFLGLLFFSFYEKHKRKSIFLFILLTIINPLSGIIIFVIWTIYFFQFDKNKNTFLFLSLVIVLTAISIKFFFSSFEENSKDFVQTYIYERHPHHYLISKGINSSFFRLLFLFAFPLFFKVSKKLKRIFLLSFIFVFGTILIQFIFIEVFPTKLFSTLTLNRAVFFTLFMLFINYFLLISFFIDERGLIKRIKIKNNINMLTTQKGYEKVFSSRGLAITAIIATILTAMLSFKRESKLPQSYIKDHDYVASWINENLDLNDVIQVCPSDVKLNYYFRIYHNKVIFWGNEFPFDQASFKTWAIRKNKIKIAEKTGEFQSIRNKIDYVVIPNKPSYWSYHLREINKENLTQIKNFAQFTIFKIN